MAIASLSLLEPARVVIIGVFSKWTDGRTYRLYSAVPSLPRLPSDARVVAVGRNADGVSAAGRHLSS